MIERADPINPIKSKLNALLNPESGELKLPSTPGEAMLSLFGRFVDHQSSGSNGNKSNVATILQVPQQMPATATAVVHDDEPHTSTLNSSSSSTAMSNFNEAELVRVISVMRSLIGQYRAYLPRSCDEMVLIEIRIAASDQDQQQGMRRQCFQYRVDDESIQPIVGAEKEEINLTVCFESYANFELFLTTKDSRYAKFSLKH